MHGQSIAFASSLLLSLAVLGCGKDRAPTPPLTATQPQEITGTTAPTHTSQTADAPGEKCLAKEVGSRVIQDPTTHAGAIAAPADQTGVELRPSVATTEGSLFVEGLEPIGGAAGTVYLRGRDKQGEPTPYFSWRPGNSDPTIVWSLAPGRQDLVEGKAGDKLVITRSGFSAPLADWELILKDEATGKNCVLATVDRDIVAFRPKTFGVPWALPTPSVSGTRIVWVEWSKNGDGGFSRRLRLYNTATAETVTLADAPDASLEGIWEPSISGEKVAWIQKKEGRDFEVVLRDLRDDSQKSYSIPVEPVKATLFDGGDRFAWDIQDGSFVYDFRTAQSVRYANIGGNTLATRTYVSSWVSPDWIGYFDAASGYFQPIDNKGATTIAAFIFGDFFLWQERRPDPSDPAPVGQKREISRYYALKLPG